MFIWKLVIFKTIDSSINKGTPVISPLRFRDSLLEFKELLDILEMFHSAMSLKDIKNEGYKTL